MRRPPSVTVALAVVAAALVGMVASAAAPTLEGPVAVEARPERGSARPVTEQLPAIAGDPVPADDGCPEAPRAAVADKMAQRFWLCVDGARVVRQLREHPVRADGRQPIGQATGRHRAGTRHGGIRGELLERFVAFYRTPRGNRIAFHEVGDQDPATVGDLDQRGASSGCFRLIEFDSIAVWNFLEVGDPVVVITP